MSECIVLAKLCTTLSECPSVVTDGMTAWVVGVPAPDADGIGPGETAVSLPLDVLLAAVDAYDRQMRQEHGVGRLVATEIGHCWGGAS